VLGRQLQRAARSGHPELLDDAGAGRHRHHLARRHPGYAFTCATRTDGTLWCWGDNGYGQLGTGTTYQTAPVQVGSTTTWSKVGAGDFTACASRTDGSLWCWGNNMAGQLGDGTTTSRSTPTRVGTATAWTTGLVVGYHTCGIRTDGGLWCWGNNANSQLGDGTTTQRPSPAQVTLP